MLPWKAIWCTRAPTMVSFFAWSVAKDKILTIDNVICQTNIIVNLCCVALVKENHSLFGCDGAWGYGSGMAGHIVAFLNFGGRADSRIVWEKSRQKRMEALHFDPSLLDVAYLE